MTPAAAILLALSAAGLLYPWVIYPLWLKSRSRRWSLITMARNHEVSVSVIIPAFNKERVILRKLRNTLTLRYPRELMEILVVADGCTDRTEELVKRVRDPRVRLISLPAGGRLASLQQAISRAKGEILVFTDANVMVRRNALHHMLRNFADWHVGGVCGTVRTRRRRTGDALGLGEALFMRYDAAVRRLEGLLGSVHAADNSLYAIRRGLFSTPRNLAQADDVAISMRVVLAGKRLVQEPRAVCFREVQPDSARELRRQRHVVNYVLRSIVDAGWYLARRPGYAFQLLSHTVARYLTPVWALLAVGSATVLVLEGALSPAILLPVPLFALCAGAGWALRRTRLGRFPLFSLSSWVASINRAYLFGLVATLTGLRPTGARPRSRVAMAARRTASAGADVGAVT